MRVLASPYPERDAANPFQNLLYKSMAGLGATIEQFTSRRLITGRWDVWHMHWPENVLCSKSKFVTTKLLVKFWCKLQVAHLKRIKIVWTVHNLRPHERRHPVLERIFWSFFLTNIDGIICMSPSSRVELFKAHPIAGRLSTFIIQHGHYRDAYPNKISEDKARKSLGIAPCERVMAFVGNIRAYKGIPELIRRFQLARLERARLIVAGRPSDVELAEEVCRAAAGNDNVQLYLRFIDGGELQNFFRAADLIVLPFIEILNSGSAILALSFDRPILVPAQGSLLDLQKLVGKEWVMLYEKELTPTVLSEALLWAATHRNPPRPSLEAFDWNEIGAATLRALQIMVR